MKSTLLIALWELRQILSDRASLLWMLLLPVVFAAFFGLLVGGPSGSEPKVKLTIEDKDQSDLSKHFIDDLKNERLQVHLISPQKKDKLTDKIRTLRIPKGFEKDIQADHQVILSLEKDPGSSAEATLVAQARIYAAIVHLLGKRIKTRVSPSSADRPPRELLTIESEFAGQAAMVPSGFAHSIPANIVMFIMLIALAFGAASITEERSKGRLKRLVCTPLSWHQIAWGKILGRVIIAWVQIVALVMFSLVANATLDVPVGNDLVSLVVVLFVYALAVAPIGVLLGSWIKDPDQAASVGVMATMVMAALGGCWWPIEIVSPQLQLAALAFPSGWAMHALHQIISFGHGLSFVALDLLVLTGFGVVFSFLAGRSLRIEQS
jgi:ABC-type Na+ efflux pump permease subunit